MHVFIMFMWCVLLNECREDQHRIQFANKKTQIHADTLVRTYIQQIPFLQRYTIESYLILNIVCYYHLGKEWGWQMLIIIS